MLGTTEAEQDTDIEHPLQHDVQWNVNIYIEHYLKHNKQVPSVEEKQTVSPDFLLSEV